MIAEKLFPLHEESSALIQAPIGKVFAFLDDPLALSAHMGKSSMMMMGSRMLVEVDAGGGKVLNSKISMHGSLLGITVALEEVIIERHEPYKKLWETIGTPQLLVIAHYRMGFELTPKGDLSMLRVFIDYNLPSTAPGSWLGRLLGGTYARWCTKQMASDAAKHFGSTMTQ